MQNDRVPITKLQELATLNDSEVIEGYHDGLEGFPCGENRSRSYWHGWRNGVVDGGYAQPDYAQTALAHEDALAKWHKMLN